MSDLRKVSSPGAGRCRWHPVTATNSTMNIKGGHNTRGETAVSIQYKIDGVDNTSLELNENSAWFLKGVGEPKTQKGDLNAITTVAILRKTFYSQLGWEDPDDHTVVADAPGEPLAVGDDSIDPMDAMDPLPDADIIKKNRKEESPKRRSHIPGIGAGRTCTSTTSMCWS